MLQIINGKVYLDGKETKNPELIGLAFLDMAENDYQTQTKSSQTFDKDCIVYLDSTIDMWVLKHLDEIVFRSKSEFDCLIEKKIIQKRLAL